MIDFYIIKLLFVLFTIAYALYLLYVKYNPKQRQKILSKYEKGTSTHELHEKLYSTRSLIAWSLIATSGVLSMAYDYSRAANAPPALLLALGVTASLVLPIIVTYLLFGLFKKK